MTATWLLCDGQLVAPVTVAVLDMERSAGLLGQDSLRGALLLEGAHHVHTFGMHFPLDVAFCDRRLRVFDVITLARNRLSRPRIRSRFVLEATAGAFQKWGISPRSQLSVVDR
jgi:uncharacterized protein